MISITAQPPSPTRSHPRVDARFMIKLFTQGKAVLAKADNLSMEGLRVIGDFLGSDERVTLSTSSRLNSKSCDSVVARPLALRGCPVSRAISPMNDPGGSFASTIA